MSENAYGISDAKLWHRIRNYHIRFPGTLTIDDLKRLIVLGERRCCWCEKKDLYGTDLTFEHLQPFNDPNVMALACKSCNFARRVGAKKRSELPEEVIEHRRKSKHRRWEKENTEAFRAMKRAEYLRAKESGARQRYIDANRDWILAEQKRYRAEKKDKIAVYQKQWDADNKAKHAEQRRAWREANPGVVKERWDEYAAEHREELNAKARERGKANRSDPGKAAASRAYKREAYRKWKAENPEAYAAAVAKMTEQKRERRAKAAEAKLIQGVAEALLVA